MFGKVPFRICVLVIASLSLSDAARKSAKYEPGGWCCLCMCHSVDENRCAAVCVRLQHGKRIIEEPTMVACTQICLRHGVKQIFPAIEPGT